MRNRLVLSAVGDDSVHNTWLDNSAERTFDLCLIYYGNQPGKFADVADVYIERKGFKYQMIHHLAQHELAEVLPKYDYVWLPDDDIAASTEQVNQLFQTASDYSLMLSQPSIGKGETAYRTLKTQSDYILRYTKFVEVMCPLFHKDALEKALPIFNDTNSCWGLDWVWSSFFEPEQIAVIDAVPVNHTRPLATGDLYKRYAEQGIDPYKELDAEKEKYGLNNRYFHKATCRGYARLQGIHLDGQKKWSRPLWTNLLHRKILQMVYAKRSLR